MEITLVNLGTVNKNKVEITKKNGFTLTLWFSYETVVAFCGGKHGFKCRQNDWSTTTGKLLNELCPDKTRRIPSDEFEKMLDEVLDF